MTVNERRCLRELKVYPGNTAPESVGLDLGLEPYVACLGESGVLIDFNLPFARCRSQAEIPIRIRETNCHQIVRAFGLHQDGRQPLARSAVTHLPAQSLVGNWIGQVLCHEGIRADGH